MMFLDITILELGFLCSLLFLALAYLLSLALCYIFARCILLVLALVKGLISLEDLHTVYRTEFFIKTSNQPTLHMNYLALMISEIFLCQMQNCGKVDFNCMNYLYVFYFTVSLPILFNYE